MSTSMSGGKRVSIRFYAELNDLLAPGERAVTGARTVPGASTVKDVIESLGVPVSEVDLILVDGEPVGSERVVEDGARVSVFPVFESLDISSVARLHSKPLRRTRFVADADLRRLARYLSWLGFDSVCPAPRDREDMLRMARDDKRTLLTRDDDILGRGDVPRGYLVRASKPRRQTMEVIRRFDLAGAIRPNLRRRPASR